MGGQEHGAAATQHTYVYDLEIYFQQRATSRKREIRSEFISDLAICQVMKCLWLHFQQRATSRKREIRSEFISDLAICQVMKCLWLHARLELSRLWVFRTAVGGCGRRVPQGRYCDVLRVGGGVGTQIHP